jgi:hypothetical protein
MRTVRLTVELTAGPEQADPAGDVALADWVLDLLCHQEDAPYWTCDGVEVAR